jgi:hypothetical protein
VLIDLGGSHSFISQQETIQLQGITPSKITRVQLAKGQVLSCSEMLKVEWYIQGYEFQSDLKVIELQNLDVVVGIDWLEKYSPMKVHWAHKWLTNPYQGMYITLQGLLLGVMDL